MGYYDLQKEYKHPRIMNASVLGGGEDIRTLAALTANRRVSPIAQGRLDAEPYPVAPTTYHEARADLLADRLIPSPFRRFPWLHLPPMICLSAWISLPQPLPLSGSASTRHSRRP